MNRAMDVEVITTLEGLGVEIAWVRRMPYPAIWLPADCVIVLNASRKRVDINAAIEGLLPEIRQHADQCSDEQRLLRGA